MTHLRNFLLIGILITVILILLTTDENNTETAQTFISKLQAGDAAALIPLFGDNTCHCQPRGGYRAYLCYESGENDSLAALIGKNFETGKMSSKEVPTDEKFKGSNLPWEQPESTELDLELNFGSKTGDYKPYFLPLDTAYGHEINENELKKFAAAPENEFWKAMALRLRPSLNEGLVPPPLPPKAGRKPEFMSDLYLELLPADQSRYIRPADPGKIVLESGAKKDLTDYAELLPRLKQCTLRLYVVRRGRYQRWSIKKGRLLNPVFQLESGKQIALKTPLEALKEQAAPAGAAQEENNEKVDGQLQKQN